MGLLFSQSFLSSYTSQYLYRVLIFIFNHVTLREWERVHKSHAHRNLILQWRTLSGSFHQLNTPSPECFVLFFPQFSAVKNVIIINFP